MVPKLTFQSNLVPKLLPCRVSRAEHVREHRFPGIHVPDRNSQVRPEPYHDRNERKFLI